MNNLIKNKRGNINIVLLVSLVVVLSGSSIISLAVNSKFDSKKSYERIQNRYIAESGADLSIGLFMNYLANQRYVMQYTKNTDGSFSVVDDYSPYLIDEIRISNNADYVALDLINTESNDYLSSIGFLGFKRNNGVNLKINTFNKKDNFKLSRICIEPNFLSGNISANNAVSKINPIYLTIKTQYKGGEVLCNASIEDLYVVRQPFKDVEKAGGFASVEAWLDTTKAKVKFNNYQNYKFGGG